MINAGIHKGSRKNLLHAHADFFIVSTMSRPLYHERITKENILLFQ